MNLFKNVSLFGIPNNGKNQKAEPGITSNDTTKLLFSNVSPRPKWFPLMPHEPSPLEPGELCLENHPFEYQGT